MSYGRNFFFRVPPEARERKGRFAIAEGASDIPIGAPVAADWTADETALGLRPVTLVTTETAPEKGTHGIMVFEHIEFRGDDPFLTVHSDKDTAEAEDAVQVVSGSEVKVLLRNTSDRTFLNTRDYTGRVIVGGLGSTLTLTEGDLLTPGPGDDTDGYWQETATAANAWLRVTKVDNDRSEVEAQMLF